MKTIGFTIVAALGLCTLLWAMVAMAGEQKDMGGWELKSSYNQLYDASEMDSFKGTIVKITEVIPMKGMSPGVGLVVRERGGDDISVHLCPNWFIEAKSSGLKRGDQVKVKGVWAVINDKDVFMASKVKKGDFFQLKVRLTKDGTPFWTMSPEQLAKERASQ